MLLSTFDPFNPPTHLSTAMKASVTGQADMASSPRNPDSRHHTSPKRHSGATPSPSPETSMMQVATEKGSTVVQNVTPDRFRLRTNLRGVERRKEEEVY